VFQISSTPQLSLCSLGRHRNASLHPAKEQLKHYEEDVDYNSLSVCDKDPEDVMDHKNWKTTHGTRHSTY